MDKRLVASRLLWFVGLWAGGVLAITIVGLVIKFWLGAGRRSPEIQWKSARSLFKRGRALSIWGTSPKRG